MREFRLRRPSGDEQEQVSTLIFTSDGPYLVVMPKTEPSESEKQYRGFQIHIEGNFAESHPFTAEWEDGLAVYFPVPKPVRFKTCADAFRTACHLIDVQYEAEAQAACQYFNPGAKP